MGKQRIIYLDVIRILACVMIIMMHAPIPNTGISSVILSTNGLLTAPGVGLFIMVSGALLLPVIMPTKDFLRKRLTKILCPTLFWTLVYMTIKLVQGDVVLSELPSYLASIPFSPQFNGVLWFIYMLIGLYLVAPIISPWLEKTSRRELELYLELWGITLCYPLIRSFVGVNESNTGILYYLGGYAGYFLLGYYLRRYSLRIPFIVCIILIALPIISGAYCKLRGVSVDFYDVFWYLSILTVIAAVGWFGLIQEIQPSNNHNWIVLVSNCCFGIYLSHIFVMRTILWNWHFLQELDGLTQIATTTVLTLIGGFLITWLLSLLPIGSYLVGYKK